MGGGKVGFKVGGGKAGFKEGEVDVVGSTVGVMMGGKDETKVGRDKEEIGGDKDMSRVRVGSGKDGFKVGGSKETLPLSAGRRSM